MGKLKTISIFRIVLKGSENLNTTTIKSIRELNNYLLILIVKNIYLHFFSPSVHKIVKYLYPYKSIKISIIVRKIAFPFNNFITLKY